MFLEVMLNNCVNFLSMQATRVVNLFYQLGLLVVNATCVLGAQLLDAPPVASHAAQAFPAAYHLGNASAQVAESSIAPAGHSFHGFFTCAMRG